MERLRWVARDSGAGPGELGREAAAALAGIGDDPVALVTACRRLVERHPAAGPVWWVTARVLCAPDPVAEARRAVAEIDADPTPATVAADLPEDATVVLLGWPGQAVEAVRRRGDLEVLLVSAGGRSSGLSARLRAAGVAVEDVPDDGLGAAVAAAEVVLLDAAAAGPAAAVAVPGSHAAAAVGSTAGVPVWVLAGAGRALPGPLWEALERRLGSQADAPWARPDELVPLALCDLVVGPDGARPAGEPAATAGCPVAPELLRPPV